MRKGHGSTKVPNVKLRPAASGSSKTRSKPPQPSAWDEVDNADDAQNQDGLLASKPLVGVVVCATGISDKTAIMEKATKLGAKASPDLTDRVTHLIASAPGSAKYKYCVEHQLPIMISSWINDLYESWLQGEDIGSDLQLDKYRLPAFTSIHICTTGISDVKRRSMISTSITRNGGAYIEDFGKGKEVTHVLCGAEVDGEDGGDDARVALAEKVQIVAKVNKRKSQKIQVVWEEWFWDSLEFGGALGEADYDVSKPRPQRRRKPSGISAAASTKDSAVDAPDAEEACQVRRVPEATTQLWAGLLKSKGFDLKSGQLVRSPSRSQSTTGSVMVAATSSPAPSPLKAHLTEMTRKPSRAGDESSIAALRRTKSALGRARSAAPVASTSTVASRTLSGTSGAIPGPSKERMGQSKRLFAGLKFRVLGEAKGQAVLDAIRNGAGSVSLANEDVDYIIVRLSSGSQFLQLELDEYERGKYRTECWLEGCIFEERICLPDEHISFLPLPCELPIKGCNNLTMHFSGLDEKEKCWALRLFKAYGVNVAEKFSRKCTHLLCPSGTGTKYTKALEWGIHVVSLGWAAGIAKSGALIPETEYLVREGDFRDPAEGEMQSHADIGSEAVDGGTMTDITNSGGSESEPIFRPSELLFESTGKEQVSPKKLVAASTASTLPSSSFSSAFRSSASFANKSPVVPKLAPPTSSGASVDVDVQRVPSSKSPSPLKLPPHQASSPPMSAGSANALKDTIASLLGKRPSLDEPEPSLVKPVKKTRQLRRTKSRQDGRTISRQTSDSPAPLPQFSQHADVGFDKTPEEESMRITYMDPVQRDEQRRLMSLLGGGDGLPPDTSSDKPARPKPRPARRGTKAQAL